MKSSIFYIRNKHKYKAKQSTQQHQYQHRILSSCQSLSRSRTLQTKRTLFSSSPSLLLFVMIMNLSIPLFCECDSTNFSSPSDSSLAINDDSSSKIITIIEPSTETTWIDDVKSMNTQEVNIYKRVFPCLFSINDD